MTRPDSIRRHHPLVLLASAALWLTAGTLAAPPTAAADDPPEEDLGVVTSYRQALGAVERAVRALGGERGASGLDSVSFTLESTVLAPYQSRTPEPPYLEVPVVLEVDAAFAARWARVETTTRFPDAEFRTVRVLGPAGAAEVDPDSGHATAAAFGWPDLERDFRRSPQLVIRDAWERRAELRWLGKVTVDGVAADLVAFPFLGRRQLTVAIDAEGRLLRHEFVADDFRHGDAAVSARFLDYRREGDRWMPRRLQQWEGAVPAVEAHYARLVVGAEAAAERFAAAPAPPAIPEAGAGEDRAAPAATGAAAADASERSTELAPGVHLVRRLEGQDYNSLIVDMGRYFAVVEAPLGQAAARQIVEAAASLDPAKPIRYVVATHFHADHAGGVPYLVAATGAAVVTTPGNAELFRDATTAHRTLAEPPISPPGPAELLLVEGDELELPGGPTLRLLDVGPTGHAAEILVAWLPESGILFQGDLIRFPDDGPLEPAREQGHRLASYLAEHGIEPEWVVGVHGRVGTMTELGEALASGAEPPAE